MDIQVISNVSFINGRSVSISRHKALSTFPIISLDYIARSGITGSTGISILKVLDTDCQISSQGGYTNLYSPKLSMYSSFSLTSLEFYKLASAHFIDECTSSLF